MAKKATKKKVAKKKVKLKRKKKREQTSVHGPVTLAHVKKMLKALGGQATWPKIFERLTNYRDGDYTYYLDKKNYKTTAHQAIQYHCPGYKKYRGIPHFEKVGKNTFRLNEKHTPLAADIEEPSRPGRVKQETYRILRDTALARKVKESHKYRCQICRQTLKLSNNAFYAEAHHVMPLGKPHNGPDIHNNILCVCPNDHALLDYGAIKLDETSLHAIKKKYIVYHNKYIYGKT